MNKEIDKLLPCPLCGSKVVWCDSLPDEDGDYHECDHILCKQCDIDFVSFGKEAHKAESFKELKEIALRKFNHRVNL